MSMNLSLMCLIVCPPLLLPPVLPPSFSIFTYYPTSYLQPADLKQMGPPLCAVVLLKVPS